MNNIARIYRAEILRAVLGPGAHEAKVANIERLNQIAEHLMDCEDAKTILRSKGYGAAGMTFVEMARSIPEDVRNLLKRVFKPKQQAPYPDIGEVHDIWTAR